MTDDDRPTPSNDQKRRARITTAGRLLQEISKAGSIDFEQLSNHLRVPIERLHACRDSGETLELELQVMLAGLVIALAPQHLRLARKLHSQAQSALRVRDGSVEGHSTYYLAHHWTNVR